MHSGDLRPALPRHGIHEEASMFNPWLEKTPYMSMWLSGANSVATRQGAQTKEKVVVRSGRQA